MNVSQLLKIGFSDKQAAVYLALLQRGPSSVRELSSATGLNRGTTYDALKWLQERGVVTFYKKESKQHFVAEDPSTLLNIVEARQAELATAEQGLTALLPELQALHNAGGERPIARYIETGEIQEVLEDVLETCEHDPEGLYRVYSAEGLRPFLYQDFPSFSDARIAKGIEVRVISVGAGGELRGLDERKWIDKTNQEPTYIIIYPGKALFFSLNAKGQPVGVVIENQGIYETQRLLFDTLWEKL